MNECQPVPTPVDTGDVYMVVDYPLPGRVQLAVAVELVGDDPSYWVWGLRFLNGDRLAFFLAAADHLSGKTTLILVRRWREGLQAAVQAVAPEHVEAVRTHVELPCIADTWRKPYVATAEAADERLANGERQVFCATCQRFRWRDELCAWHREAPAPDATTLTDRVRKAILEAGVEFIEHHACGVCGCSVGYRILDGHPYYSSNCCCSDYFTPLTSRAWEDLATWLNACRDPVLRSEMQRIGLNLDGE